MGIVSICFGLHCHISDMSSNKCEDLYNNGLKKLIAFLYNNPNVCFSFYFPGPFVEWIEQKHSESIIVLRELINKKQVEIIGGGYYEPIFSLILPQDRVGQIEQNTTYLRKQFGKKTRGIFLGDSVWDPVLISSFNSCGMEYAVVNNSLIPSEEPKGKIFIVEDMGKTMNIIPYQEYNYTEAVDPQFYLEKIKRYSDLNHSEAYQNDNRIYYTSFSITKIGSLLESNWLEIFCNLVEHSPLFDFTLPAAYIKNNTDYIRSFIPAGCPDNIQKWAVSPFTSVTNEFKSSKNTNIRNFLNTYQEVQYLYSRMMYTCMLIDQFKGDKIRKTLMRESIWKAQVQDSYLFLGDAGVCNPKNRSDAYKNLLIAEKTVRENNNAITDSFKSFDYDMDGRKEYIIHKKNYNAFISLCGGIIFELDLISNAKNYCDTMKRVEIYDNATDLYPKKLFIDHLMDIDNFERYVSDASSCNAVFSQIIYHEQVYDRVRKELALSASALFGILQQPVTLKKKFQFTDNGIKVQYILKNESPLPLKCYFAVESNLCFNGTASDELSIELISENRKEKIENEHSYQKENGVSLLQFSDLAEKNTFIFETNEDSGLCIHPLYIKRPINGITEKRYQATTSCFFWKIDIPPSYEFEKTLFLGIISSKKSKKIHKD